MIRRIIPLAIVVALTACNSGNSALDAGNATATSAPAASSAISTAVTEPIAPATSAVIALPDCPVDLDSTGGPIAITYWHGMNGENENAINALAEQFNASQNEVVVTVENQGGYLEVIDKYYQSGPNARPDLVMFPEYGFQQTIDSDTVIPVESCLTASGYATDEILPAALSAFSAANIQWGMPFNISNPVLYYNKQIFAAAGLDPERPPATLDEVREMSQQIVESGAANAPFVYDSNIDSGGGWFIEEWFANAGDLFVDNDNGRGAPASEVLVDGERGVELFTFLQQMHDDGLLTYVGDNASGQDSFLKLADRQDPGAMVIGTSAGLGTVVAVLGSGVIEGLTTDDIGVAPMPGVTGTPAVAVGGAANYVVDSGDPAKIAAAWAFATYLLEPASQSQWAASTGYVPIVSSAVDLDPIAAKYADDPRYRVAYDQLLGNDGSPAAAGALIGPHRQVRVATASAVAAIFAGTDVATALSEAAVTSDRLLSDYAALSSDAG